MTNHLDPEALEAARLALGRYNSRGGWLNEQAEVTISAYLAALPAPRTITTVEELEALPVGSVIADLYDDRGDAPIVLCKANNGEWAALTTGTRMGIPWWASRDIAHVARRLRVLHVPTEGGGE